MATVREWLVQNGLGGYADTFQQERFHNFDRLKQMTTDDLSALIPPRGDQAKFRGALSKRFGEDTMIYKQLIGSSSRKEETPVDQSTAGELGHFAFEKNPHIQTIMGGIGQKSPEKTIEMPKSAERQIGYTRWLISFISNSPSCFQEWIAKPLRAILGDCGCTIKQVRQALLFGYNSPKALLDDIGKKLTSITNKGWGWLAAHWKEVCVAVLALIVLTVLVLVVFGYIPDPAMFSSVFGSSGTVAEAVTSANGTAAVTAATAPADLGANLGAASEFNEHVQNVYSMFSSSYNMDRSVIGLGLAYNY